MSIQSFNMEMEVVRQIFYSEESAFGIFAMKPVEYTTDLQFNKYGNISLQGKSRPLKEGDKHLIKFNGTHSHPKYGDYYEIDEVAPDRLDTIQNQDNFLKAILTKHQFDSLKEAYPNQLLVDLITDGKIDVSKTKGIKKTSLENITRKVTLNAGISVLIAKLNELTLSTNALNRILNHFENASLAVVAIEENIFNLCEVDGYGFKTVDKIYLMHGGNPTSQERICACIDFVLKKDNQSGHTWTSKEALEGELLELLSIDSHFIDYEIDRLSRRKRYFVEGDRIAFSWTRSQEESVYAHLKRIHNNYISPNTSFMKQKLKEIEKEQGFEFTDEQREAILDGVNHGVMLINGKAGGGKTATVAGLIKCMDNPHYVTCALSGAAVRILDLRGVSAATIHRMLKYSGGDEGFSYNEYQPMPYDLVIVDEISMVSIPLFLSVVKAIKDGCKLIISGDSGQLSGIGVGNLIRDLLETRAFPSYELTKVHRQAAKSGVLSIANEIREGKQIMPYNSTGREVYGELQDMTVISYGDKTHIPNDVIKIAKQYNNSYVKRSEDLFDFQVIVPNRDRGELSVRHMNNLLQDIFNKNRKSGLRRNNYEYCEGDKVLAMGNSYNKPIVHSIEDYESYREALRMSEELEDRGFELDEELEEALNREEVSVFNGTAGYIHSIVNKTALIKFIGMDYLVPFDQADLDKIDMGYAITVHRSQGSTIKHVVFALDFAAYTLLTRQLVYVGLTRASDRCVLLCEGNALYQAISNDESGNRRTFLREIIRDDFSGLRIVKAAELENTDVLDEDVI